MTNHRPLLTVSPEAAITAAAEAVLDGAPQGLSRLAGGMNNVIYRLDCAGRPLVGKLYFRHPADGRDRLGTEFAMLSFLWDRGLRCVPEPVRMSLIHGVGFYGYVDGARLSGSPVVERDLDESAQFLVRMWELSQHPSATALPLASDAAFTIRERFATVADRLARLAEAVGPGAARSFLRDEAAPFLKRLSQWAQQVAGVARVTIDEPVPTTERVLSQGDVGLHNCLRTRHGLVFHDFEYGGWDDLAQVMVQVCLAPAVRVPDTLHAPLLSQMVESLDGSEFLVLRATVNYPLLALKWGLIMLNELIDVGRARRSFSGATVDTRVASRISSAKKMLSIAERAMGPASPLSHLVATDRGC